ncbi:MAG: AAA family ATPase [Bacteroidetes bacterium]|nr:AAA family ATPase [Bacteroidota bacterium]
MELIERAEFLSLLHAKFESVEAGEGHCVFISGEGGIGKSSLAKKFSSEVKNDCEVYLGTCDSLFTPRPLAPLYDILDQIGTDLRKNFELNADRTELFTNFFNELKARKDNIVIVFEDIHWADEATLDFIKFFSRRITQLRCLFILTYRDNEIHAYHPLRNVLGQLSTDTYTRIQLPPLSKEVVTRMSVERGYNGEDVFSISGGIPFYVNEILANYSPGVPANIRDSVLAVYNRHKEEAKKLWQILSILPTGLETKYMESMEPDYATALDVCMAGEVIILKDDRLVFKHELYRRTIEDALSPLLRIYLNKKILELFRASFEKKGEIERIIHHAKNANEYDLVVHYAPIAASQAASVGAHLEAHKLRYTAIEYYQGNDRKKLIELYDSYAYECYLINQINDAIIYTGKSLNLWKELEDVEKIANCMRFLSRLWWFNANKKLSEQFAENAIEVLADQPASKIKAMAYSNMAQLKMLAEQPEECLFWGNKAIQMAKEVSDEETLCHALNNVGVSEFQIQSSVEKGRAMLMESLDIALKNSFHEHVGRAYANLSATSIVIKDYAFARKMLDKGIEYCDGREMDSWTPFMLVWKSRLHLETGEWRDAMRITNNLLESQNLSIVVRIAALTITAVIKMRRGEQDVLPLLFEAEKKAFDSMEMQRIAPVMTALLEYEWITGKLCIEKEALDRTIGMFEKMGNVLQKNEFAFWLKKARRQEMKISETFAGFEIFKSAQPLKNAEIWEKLGCPYEQALALFAGDDDEKRKALAIVSSLGADAVFEKMKSEMRSSGIKSIPRGIRKSTRSNVALLTNRELDVLQLLKDGMQNKEIANTLFISAKTVDHHISSILLKLDVNSRVKAVQEAARLAILK